MPVVELGLGWSFAVGRLDVGPSARWLRVISNDTMDAFGSADLIVAGVDVAWGRPRRPARPASPPRRVAATVARRAPEPPPPPPPAERDVDRLVDRDASCAEVLDGCPIAEHVVVREDRIVLDERVLFDLGRSRVRSRGRAVIADIARAWRGHPEWRRITIEGHTDVRGTDAFNQRLSERRAARARAALLRHGFEPDQIDAIGYGRSRPRSQGRDEAAHTRNRRVEFVIVRDVADRVMTSEVSP